MFVSQLKMGYFKHPSCEFSHGSNASRDVLRSKNVWLRLRRASGGWGARPPNPLSPSGKAPTRPQKPHPRAASGLGHTLTQCPSVFHPVTTISTLCHPMTVSPPRRMNSTSREICLVPMTSSKLPTQQKHLL